MLSSLLKEANPATLSTFIKTLRFFIEAKHIDDLYKKFNEL